MSKLILLVVTMMFLVSLTLSAADFGAERAIETDNLTFADMLTYAMQDEYLARAEYMQIMETYGSMRPFSNIVKAEETHISLLTPLFERYGYKIPDLPPKNWSRCYVNIREENIQKEAGIYVNLSLKVKCKLLYNSLY